MFCPIKMGMARIRLILGRNQWRIVLNVLNLFDPIKFLEILEQQSDWCLLKIDLAPWT
jgi:hypothetical protein